MSEQEKKKTIGTVQLIEFGKYLESLHGTGRTFELEDGADGMRDCSLEEVLQAFQSFFDRRAAVFRVRICYVDHEAGTMGHTTTEFKRIA